MLDFMKYSEEEYMELMSLCIDLAQEFRDQWEADPFGDPDLTEFLDRAETQGNLDARDELAGVLETYIMYFAPTPKYSEEQYEAKVKMVRETISEYRERESGTSDSAA